MGIRVTFYAMDSLSVLNLYRFFFISVFPKQRITTDPIPLTLYEALQAI